MIKSLSDLEVSKLSNAFAMDIFFACKGYPKEEKYSLTDQIVRASRSIAANIGEGWGRRIYENEFKKHLVYAMGSLEETKVWLQFSKDCNYLSGKHFEELWMKADLIGSKLYRLHENWKSF